MHKCSITFFLSENRCCWWVVGGSRKLLSTFVCQKSHSLLSLFWAAKTAQWEGITFFWVMEMLCHGISHGHCAEGEAPGAWRVVVESLSRISHFRHPSPSQSLWCPLAFLHVHSWHPSSEYVYTSTQLSKQLLWPHKHLLSTKASVDLRMFEGTSVLFSFCCSLLVVNSFNFNMLSASQSTFHHGNVHMMSGQWGSDTNILHSIRLLLLLTLFCVLPIK